MGCFGDLNWKPLVGLLDNRSLPDAMPASSFRRKLNFFVPNENTLCRRPGWSKFLDNSGYQNEDLHDQLLALQTYYDPLPSPNTADPEDVTEYPSLLCGAVKNTRAIGRQPISMLFPVTSTTGARRLIAGTESRIYLLNEKAGNWKILGDGFGEGVSNGSCPQRRFYAAQNLDDVIFTNNMNRPVYWHYGQGTFGCDQQAVREIPDLAIIGLTKAQVIWTWKGVTFLADVEMDGARFENRMVWSDYNDGISFDPGKPESIAGFQDLDSGERIIGALEQGDYLIVYTTKRIWQVTVVGGAATFNFQKKYSPEKSGDRCLFYRNTLIAVDDLHWFLGEDGVYAYSIYMSKPERSEWVHRGTATMFSEINKTCCDQTVAGYNPNTKEALFSYPTQEGEGCCPAKTLIVNTKYPDVSELDHGFTAFTFWQPDPRGTVRDFIIENCICTDDQMDASGYKRVKEGIGNMTSPPVSCPTVNSIYTDDPKDEGDGLIVEDYTKETSDPDSLCANFFSGVRLDTLCQRCDTAKLFVMASSQDWCLKQVSNAFYRERCTNPEGVGTEDAKGYHSSVGEYDYDGYSSILASGAITLAKPDNDKAVAGFMVQQYPELQTLPGKLHLRVGMSATPEDVLRERCGILWDEKIPDISIDCQTQTVEKHAKDRTRPDEGSTWPLYYIGKCIYWELSVAGTGASVCLSEASMGIRIVKKC